MGLLFLFNISDILCINTFSLVKLDKYKQNADVESIGNLMSNLTYGSLLYISPELCRNDIRYIRVVHTNRRKSIINKKRNVAIVENYIDLISIPRVLDIIKYPEMIKTDEYNNLYMLGSSGYYTSLKTRIKSGLYTLINDKRIDYINLPNKELFSRYIFDIMSILSRSNIKIITGTSCRLNLYNKHRTLVAQSTSFTI